jgi:hypothetical protein
MELVSTPNMIITMKQNERTYTFSMPMGSPIGEAYDAAYMVLSEIMKFAKQAEEAAKRQENNS